MKTTLTVRLKLTTSPERFKALRRTQLVYRDALNLVSAYSFAHGRRSNSERSQKATYLGVRTKFGLPAQIGGSVPRQVAATHKALVGSVAYSSLHLVNPAAATQRCESGNDMAERLH